MLTRRDLLCTAARTAAVAAVAPALLASEPARGAARAAGPLAQRLGAYCGTAAPDAAAALEQHLGRSLALVHDFVPTTEDWSRLYDQPYAFDQHWTAPGSRYADRLYLSVPMLVARDTAVTDGRGRPTTLAQAAAGAYDEHYAALGRQLVRKGLGDVRVRIGWEMNVLPGPSAPGGADWSAGSTRHGEVDFVRAYRRMVAAMRAVPGAGFRFVWCPAIGSSWSRALGRPIDAAACYPGDDYVSIIACDVYDRSWSQNTHPDRRWRDIATDRYGNRASLAWFERFASPGHLRPNNDGSAGVGRWHAGPGASRPLGLGEFGTFRLAGERPGERDGGDDPRFLRRLLAWMEGLGAERWDHLNYWNFGSPGRLGPRAALPRWDATARELFGPGTRASAANDGRRRSSVR